MMSALFTPKKLHIQNFCSIAEEQTFTFREGLFFIQGINEDSTTANSNGSGKSLLIEALCWALWGKTLRDFSLEDEVINRHVGRDCRVRLEFTLAGNTYEIVRKRGVVSKYEKRNDLLFYVNGVNASGNSMAETQQAIIGVLGSLTFDTFSLMMPGARADLAQMTHGQIVQALEELLTLDNLLVARKKLGKDLKQVQEKDQELQKQQDALHIKRDLLENTKKAYNVDALLTEKQGALQAYASLADQELRLKKQQELLTAAQTQDAHLTEAMAKLVDLMNSLLQEKQLHHQRLTTLRTEQTNLCAQLDRQIKELQAQKQAAQAQQGTCTLCGSPVLPGHIEKHLDTLQTKIDALSEEKQQFVNNQQQLVVETQSLYDKVLVKLDEVLHEKKGLQERSSSWTTQLNLLRSTVQTTTREVLQQRTELTTVISQVEKRLTEAQEQLALAESQLLEIDQELALLDVQRAETQKQAAHLEYWYSSLDLEGFRVHVLMSVLPYLTARAQAYATLLSDGELHVSFLPKKNSKTLFHVHVVNNLGAAVYKGFSKGEKGKVNLAVSLALADLASQVSSTKLSFRFFDEAFDGIDKTGMTLLITLLNAQAKDHKSIYVISHNPDIESMISDVITVRKKKDTTYIEDSL